MLRFQANLGLKNLLKKIYTQEFQELKTKETRSMLLKKKQKYFEVITQDKTQGSNQESNKTSTSNQSHK